MISCGREMFVFLSVRIAVGIRRARLLRRIEEAASVLFWTASVYAYACALGGRAASAGARVGASEWSRTSLDFERRSCWLPVLDLDDEVAAHPTPCFVVRVRERNRAQIDDARTSALERDEKHQPVLDLDLTRR